MTAAANLPASLACPTVHLNGTGGAELLRQLEAADAAVRAALDALREAAPNGRDYYPQGNGAIATAMSQHHDRLRALDRVHQELARIYEDVFHQVETRRRP